MDHNPAQAIQPDRCFPIPKSPHCFQCRAPATHVRRASDLNNGDHYDVFACSACDYVSWMPITEH